MLWFGYLERLEENSWHIEDRKFDMSSSLAQKRSRKTPYKVMRRDLEEWVVSKELGKKTEILVTYVWKPV